MSIVGIGTMTAGVYSKGVAFLTTDSAASTLPASSSRDTLSIQGSGNSFGRSMSVRSGSQTGRGFECFFLICCLWLEDEHIDAKADGRVRT